MKVETLKLITIELARYAINNVATPLAHGIVIHIYKKVLTEFYKVFTHSDSHYVSRDS